MTTNLDQIRCAWVTPVLGVDGNLLYFGPLLRTLANHFQKFTVFTGEYTGSIKKSGLDIRICGDFKRLYKNERRSGEQTSGYVSGISIAKPEVITELRANKAQLIVINEFSLFSFYATVSKLFMRNSRILCIVESRPQLADRPLTGFLRKQFRRLMARFCDAFLTNNESGLKYIVNDLGIDQTKVVAKPYLVSDIGAQGTAIRANRSDNGPLHFLYVGGLVKRKGLDRAIEACRILSTNQNKSFVFDIVGDGPCRSELEQLVIQYNLQDRIFFHGRQKYEDLAQFYANSDAFLFPTLSDYRALTPFEALSFGLPIFASVCDGGISETVINGENGYSFHPDNPNNIADRLKILLDKPELVERFSRKSLEISKKYNLEAAIDTLTSACRLALEH